MGEPQMKHFPTREVTLEQNDVEFLRMMIGEVIQEFERHGKNDIDTLRASIDAASDIILETKPSFSNIFTRIELYVHDDDNVEILFYDASTDEKFRLLAK